MFNYAKEWQFLKRKSIYSIFDVSKLDKSNDVKDLQPSNIPPIFVTDEVSKLCKSKEINELQYWNILNIDWTEDVLKLSKFTDIKELQSANIKSRYTTFEESNLDKSAYIMFFID